MIIFWLTYPKGNKNLLSRFKTCLLCAQNKVIFVKEKILLLLTENLNSAISPGHDAGL